MQSREGMYYSLSSFLVSVPPIAFLRNPLVNCNFICIYLGNFCAYIRVRYGLRYSLVIMKVIMTCPPFWVSGPKSPKDVDIYMAPLLESLLDFWRGIWTCDVSRPLSDPNRHFLLRAMVLWTIHDWPGLGSCSGLKTSGYAACHKCGRGLPGRRSESMRKIVYHEHRCWLDEDDPLREDLRYILGYTRAMTSTNWPNSRGVEGGIW